MFNFNAVGRGIKRGLVLTLFLIFGVLFNSFAQQVMRFTVGDTVREALVYIPATAKTQATPVVFAYHGHGGTARNMFRTRGFEKLWPEAIVVCPQGLNTPGQLTDPQGKLPGWQAAPGDMGDRDLHFFDAMLKTLRQDYKVDDKRIYATGHSNGGGEVWIADNPDHLIHFNGHKFLGPF